MRLITWNVNGLRSLKKSVQEIVKEFDSDVVCFQETKISRSQLQEDSAIFTGYSSYFSFPRRQSGYSGVATYCSDVCSPFKAEDGLFTVEKEFQQIEETIRSDADLQSLDGEGRAVITYHKMHCGDDEKTLVIINVYCPRVDPEKPERHVFKMQFLDLLAAKAHFLIQSNCFVVILGDMNIAHHCIDSCDPGDEEEFNQAEHRQWLTSFLLANKAHYKEPFVDVYRHFHPDQKEAYTCWNTRTSARQTNYGTRIDYFLVNASLMPYLKSCEILFDVYGSDHCPVSLNLDLEMISSQQLPRICTRLWPEFAGRQQTLKAFIHTTKRKSPLKTQEPVKKLKANDQKSITNFFLTNNEKKNTSKCNEILKPPAITDTLPKEFEESQNKQSSAWKAMLSGPPKPPLCSGHNRPCVLRTVKKSGMNCGRQFFSCPQPAGSESNPESSCNFFQWVTPMKKSN